jgi:hypothetical protein
MDMNVDGEVNVDDVSTMIMEVFRTIPGDFNLDGSLDAADYVVWRKGLGASGALFTQGDADFDGDVDSDDRLEWQADFGFARQPIVAGAASAIAAVVPEPASAYLLLLGAMLTRRIRRKQLKPGR